MNVTDEQLHRLSSSWGVVYKDGSRLDRWTMADTELQETPLRSINWEAVDTINLESQFFKQSFKIGRVPDGHRIQLRTRNLITMGAQIPLVSCYMIIEWKGDKDSVPTKNNVVYVIYWFPNGAVHHCSDFDCSEVRKFNIARKKNIPASIKQYHGIKRSVILDGLLIAR